MRKNNGQGYVVVLAGKVVGRFALLTEAEEIATLVKGEVEFPPLK